MQEKGRPPKILGNDLPLINYPDNSITTAIEQKIELTLPFIEGLNDPTLPDAGRLAILKQSTDTAYQSFVSVYGDPLGEIITPACAYIEQAEEELLSGKLSESCGECKNI